MHANINIKRRRKWREESGTYVGPRKEDVGKGNECLSQRSLLLWGEWKMKWEIEAKQKEEKEEWRGQLEWSHQSVTRVGPRLSPRWKWNSYVSKFGKYFSNTAAVCRSGLGVSMHPVFPWPLILFAIFRLLGQSQDCLLTTSWDLHFLNIDVLVCKINHFHIFARKIKVLNMYQKTWNILMKFWISSVPLLTNILSCQIVVISVCLD